MNKGIIGIAAGFAFLVILLVSASISNTGNFYLKNSKDGLVVYQGKFAPTGKYKLMTLPEIYAPEKIKKDGYDKGEVYGLIYTFYIDKVKELAKSKGTPDFDKIEKYLRKAKDFALGSTEKAMIRKQLKALSHVSENYKTELLKLNPTESKPEQKEVSKPAVKHNAAPEKKEAEHKQAEKHSAH